MSTNVERVLDEIKSMTSEEQQQIRVALNSRATTKSVMTEDEFEQHLLASGVITEISPPPTEAEIEAFRNYKPITVEGKPVSQTIIEERG